jgi:NADPH-dependent ferric siderophore reductase
MTATLDAPAQVAWRFFDTVVAAVHRLSPSFVRITLTGPDLDDFADNGLDQRFKLVLPDAHGSYDALPRDPEWYAAWRRLPEDRRNPIRTYTVRAVRPQAREVDVDLVLHGDTGPASRFASSAAVGDRLVVLGPNRRYGDAHGGLEFRPPARHTGPTLLVGDATAAPAVLTVLEQLPAYAFGEVVLEVPDAADIADVAAPVGFRVTWLVRQDGDGSGLAEAVDVALARTGRGGAGRGGPWRGTPEHPAAPDRGVVAPVVAAGDASLPEPLDDEPLWDVPEDARAEGLYAWIAGESSLVTGLRRHLVRDLGVDRRSVAFMGYWREGRPGG